MCESRESYDVEWPVCNTAIPFEDMYHKCVSTRFYTSGFIEMIDRGKRKVSKKSY